MSTQIFTSDSPKADCIYGESGTGKTTQVGRMARYVYETTGKITRLITADPGGHKAIDPYVNVGIIQVISLLDEKLSALLDMTAKLFQGYWPFDPVTGEPLLRKVDPKDPNSKMVYDFTNVKAKPTPETWKKVGGYAIEGLHSLTVALMDYLTSHPEITGELAGAVGTKNQGQVSQIKEGSEVYVQPGKASYGYAQKQTYKWVRQSCELPVHKVLWTSLPKLYETKDKDGNVIETEHWYPSMAAGTAALRATPQWFGMLMAMETIQLSIEKEDRPSAPGTRNAEQIGFVNTEIRAYLRDHTLPKDKRIMKAKPRIAWECVGEVPQSFKVTLKPEKEGQVHDLYSLYKLEDKLQGKATDEVAEFKRLVDEQRKAA